MNKEKTHQILKIITKAIENESFEWRLDGSTNLLVQGIEVEPKDLDIRTWKEGIDIFRKNLKEYIKKDYYNDTKKAFSLILNILGEEVEINYYIDWDEDKSIKLKEIIWDKIKLKGISLKDAEILYRKIGRIEAADKLKKILSRNK